MTLFEKIRCIDGNNNLKKRNPVYTNDKDMMQLIDSNVKQYKKPQKTNDYEVITVESFKEKYNLEPDQMRDLLGLMGDSADNIPGIPGILSDASPIKAFTSINSFGVT